MGMKFIEITTNGDHVICRGETEREGGLVTRTGNASPAITIGYLDDTDTFNPFADGVITDDSERYVSHGIGCRLAVNVTGAAGTVKIGYAG